MIKFYRALSIFSIALFCSFQLHSDFKEQLVENIAAVGIGILANVGLDYMNITCHELGHALVNKAITGDPVKISVQPSQMNGYLKILAPWEGRAYFATDSNAHPYAHAAITAAGPITGILATQGQLYLLGLLQNHFFKKPQQEVWKEPLTFLKELYKGTEYTTARYFDPDNALGMEKPVHFKNYLTKDATLLEKIAYKSLNFIRALRCVKLMGEIIYGFTPVSIPDIAGDGQVLWRILLKRDHDKTPCIGTLETIANCGVVSPILLGALKAFTTYSSYKSPSREK